MTSYETEMTHELRYPYQHDPLMMLPRAVWAYENNYMGVMEDRSINSTGFPSDESKIVKWAWKSGGCTYDNNAYWDL